MRLRALFEKQGTAGTTADAVYQALRHAILHGDLAPGGRLRSDGLANELRVSRTPVREALRKLEAEGLVAASSSGLIVRALSEQDLTELFYVREALEGMAARLAADNAGTLDFANLRAIIGEIKACGSNLKRMRVLTGDFQLLVFRAARNDTIYRLLRHLQDQIRQFSGTTLTQPGRAKEAAAYCANLFAAIERRDADAAEKIARENRRRTLELRIKMLRAAPGNTA